MSDTQYVQYVRTYMNSPLEMTGTDKGMLHSQVTGDPLQ